MCRYLRIDISTVFVYVLIILGNQTDVDSNSNQKYIYISDILNESSPLRSPPFLLGRFIKPILHVL